MKTYTTQQQMIIEDLREISDTVILESPTENHVLRGIVFVEDTARAAGIASCDCIDYSAMPNSIPCNGNGIISNQKG